MYLYIVFIIRFLFNYLYGKKEMEKEPKKMKIEKKWKNCRVLLLFDLASSCGSMFSDTGNISLVRFFDKKRLPVCINHSL